MMELPTQGRPVADVLADLEAKRGDDVAWADGRTFGMVYDGGPSVHEVIDGAARMFLHDNALNTQAFPSLGAIQSEVVRLDRRPAPRPRDRRRVPHQRRDRVDPVRGPGGT